MKLHISDVYSLPQEAVTQTFAVLAKRGVGKTYTGSVMAEEMLEAGQVVLVIDPTGAWHGLRSSADGKGPGYPIVVIGGDAADIPLNESAGEIIAQAVVENRFSAILDLSLLRKGAVRRFLTPFIETLYRLNREPLHVFVDEADDVIPQRPMGDEAPLVGAFEDLVKRGRRKGIGCTLITQRPADLAKQVLTQCEVLVAMRLVHPRDIKAIEEWVNVHGDPVIAKQMIDSLPALAVGTAWFWSPGWLGEMQQVKIRRRETFDSSATPKVGEIQKKPRARAEVDIPALGRQIADAAEKAKADDPKELRKRIAELEKQLRERPAETKVEKVVERVEVPVMLDQQRKDLASFASSLMATSSALANTVQQLDEITAPVRAFQPRREPFKTWPPDAGEKSARPSPKPAQRSTESNGALPKGEAITLRALIQYPNGLERKQLTTLTGYKRSTRDSYIQRLGEKGYAEVEGNVVLATNAGRVALPDAKPLPTGVELQEFWLQRLPEGERRILEELIIAYPDSVERTSLDEATGFKRSTRDSYLQRLAAKELVEDAGRGAVQASGQLFE